MFCSRERTETVLLRSPIYFNLFSFRFGPFWNIFFKPMNSHVTCLKACVKNVIKVFDFCYIQCLQFVNVNTANCTPDQNGNDNWTDKNHFWRMLCTRHAFFCLSM